MMKSALFAFVLLFVALAAAQTVEYSTGQLSIRVNPQNGTVLIWETGSSRVFTHTFLSVAESNTSGIVVNEAKNFFDNQTFTAGSSISNNIQGVNTSSVSLTASGAWVSGIDGATSRFTLAANFFLFTQDGTILFNGKNVSVAPDMMYITYQIQGWPTQSNTNNTIALRTRIDTPGRTGSLDSSVLRLTDGAAITYATASQASSPVVVSATASGSSSVDVTVQLKADINLAYDALYSVEPAGADDGGNGDGNSSAASALTSPLFAFF